MAGQKNVYHLHFDDKKGRSNEIELTPESAERISGFTAGSYPNMFLSNGSSRIDDIGTIRQIIATYRSAYTLASEVNALTLNRTLFRTLRDQAGGKELLAELEAVQESASKEIESLATLPLGRLIAAKQDMDELLLDLKGLINKANKGRPLTHRPARTINNSKNRNR